jgi:hypothetical protein
MRLEQLIEFVSWTLRKQIENGINPIYDFSAIRISVYRRKDADTCKYLVIGKDCLYAHPPEWMPIDTLSGKGRDYLFVGWLDLNTLQFVPEVMPNLPKFENT